MVPVWDKDHFRSPRHVDILFLLLKKKMKLAKNKQTTESAGVRHLHFYLFLLLNTVVFVKG